MSYFTDFKRVIYQIIYYEIKEIKCEQINVLAMGDGRILNILGGGFSKIYRFTLIIWQIKTCYTIHLL